MVGLCSRYWTGDPWPDQIPWDWLRASGSVSDGRLLPDWKSPPIRAPRSSRALLIRPFMVFKPRWFVTISLMPCLYCTLCSTFFVDATFRIDCCSFSDKPKGPLNDKEGYSSGNSQSSSSSPSSSATSRSPATICSLYGLMQSLFKFMWLCPGNSGA